jgi:hypothetical protein
LATEYFVSEYYDNGTGHGGKGSIVGEEAGAIRVSLKGWSIEKLWPDARVFSHELNSFVAPLSSADITRLGSTDQNILFYVSHVWMHVTEVWASDSSLRDILFAYQTLRDKTVHWTLNSTIDAQAAINKAILRSNIRSGIQNALFTVIALPGSLFLAKRLVQDATIKAETLPAMEVLKRFVQKHAKR